MIDQDKMRRLLARINDCTKPVDAADRSGVLQYIDALLAEVEAANRELELSKLRVMGSNAAIESITKLIDKLRAELEAAAADKRDAATLREIMELRVSMKQRGDEVDASDKETKSHTFFDAEFNRRKWLLIDAIDAALAQRQGEGS